MVGQRCVIYRFEVPVDDQWHKIPLTGDILHVGCRRPEMVEFWALHYPSDEAMDRWFRVVGTGHPIEPRLSWTYVGTALVPSADLVWHLISATRDPAGED